MGCLSFQFKKGGGKKGVLFLKPQKKTREERNWKDAGTLIREKSGDLKRGENEMVKTK